MRIFLPFQLSLLIGIWPQRQNGRKKRPLSRRLAFTFVTLAIRAMTAKASSRRILGLRSTLRESESCLLSEKRKQKRQRLALRRRQGLLAQMRR